jgi:hypothetical protein
VPTMALVVSPCPQRAAVKKARHDNRPKLGIPKLYTSRAHRLYSFK